MKIQFARPFLSRIFLFLAAFFMFVGFGIRILFNEWDVTSFFYLGAGGVFFILSLFFDFKSFTNFFKLKTARKSFSLGATLFLLALALFAVNWGTSFLPYKIDFTPNNAMSLSEFSQKVIKSFQQNVEILYLQMPDNESPSADETVRVAVQKYMDVNPNIQFRKVNIMKHPELVQRFKLNDQEQAMFLVMGDRYERFYKTDENSLTQAFLRLLKGRKTLYFSVGHGELSVENTNSRGISYLKKEVERLFYDVQEINLDREILPDNAAALIVLAPEQMKEDAFKNKILDYFNKGGRVYIAFDPVQNADNDKFLHKIGLEMSSGIVHQEENSIANLGSQIVSGSVPREPHALTGDMGNDSPVMFYVTGALTEILPHETQIQPIIVSAPTSVLRQGYTKQDKEIRRGSFSLVSAVSNAQNGLIIVSADSDIFANQFLYQQMNPTFMFHVFSYLTKDEDLVKTLPQRDHSKDFLVTDVHFKLYIGLFALPLPLFFLSMAGFIWYRRRWL